MEIYGFSGWMLYVDLTEGKIRKVPIDLELAGRFIGGWGIGCKLAYDLIKPGIDPLSPVNPIIISAGVLVGTSVPSAARIVATFKSPLLATEEPRKYMIAYGTAGTRRFGWNLKCAGYDQIVITGKSERPVYLRIDDDEVEICDADDLWGEKDTYETTDVLEDRYEGCGVISIGRAGENLVRYSMALVDKNGTFGRHGLGAVMGSKNLKAIVARGTKGVKVSDPKRLSKVVDEMAEKIKQSPWLKPFHQVGAHAGWSAYKSMLHMGVWSVEEYDKHYGIPALLSVKRYSAACATCILSCRIGYRVKDGRHAGLETDTGHGVVLSMIGERLELKDIRDGLKYLDMCNRAGLCAYASSGPIDWLTRLYEGKAITEEETGGLALTRSLGTYLRLLEMIINREGLGDTLADGWILVSEKLGRDARKEYVWGSGGIQKGVAHMIDPRTWGLSANTLGEAVNPRAHHGNMSSALAGPPVTLDWVKGDLEEMAVSRDEFLRIFTPATYYGVFNAARMARHIEDRGNILNCLGCCDSNSIPRFLPVPNLAECYSAATGIETTPEMLKKVGERVSNLYKIINVREGFSREDDEFPEAWFKPIMTPEGPATMKDYYKTREIIRDDAHQLLDDYYDERGWDIETGIPTQEKLKELGLEEYIKDLPE